MTGTTGELAALRAAVFHLEHALQQATRDLTTRPHLHVNPYAATDPNGRYLLLDALTELTRARAALGLAEAHQQLNAGPTGVLVELTRISNDRQARIDRALNLDPAEHATGSRDFGRGFTHALTLVREALTGET